MVTLNIDKHTCTQKHTQKIERHMDGIDCIFEISQKIQKDEGSKLGIDGTHLLVIT
jgi:hypothetical protein